MYIVIFRIIQWTGPANDNHLPSISQNRQKMLPIIFSAPVLLEDFMRKETKQMNKLKGLRLRSKKGFCFQLQTNSIVFHILNSALIILLRTKIWMTWSEEESIAYTTKQSMIFHIPQFLKLKAWLSLPDRKNQQLKQQSKNWNARDPNWLKFLSWSKIGKMQELRRKNPTQNRENWATNME